MFQVIEDKKGLRFFPQLLFILFYLGITVLSSGRDKAELERRETIYLKKTGRDDHLIFFILFSCDR
jgi:hypothetical protein